MKRECLLSKAYTGAPMIFNGAEIAFSAAANEILREMKTAFFTGDGDGKQTHHLGLCEGVLVMYLLALGDKAKINDLRRMSREDRSKEVLDFAIEHEFEIERIKTDILERMESTLAAMVESEVSGKSQAPAQAS